MCLTEDICFDCTIRLTEVSPFVDDRPGGYLEDVPQLHAGQCLACGGRQALALNALEG